MTAKQIIKQVKEILDSNDITTSNIRKNKESLVLNIHEQDSIKKFFDIVKPSNLYHKERFLN